MKLKPSEVLILKKVKHDKDGFYTEYEGQRFNYPKKGMVEATDWTALLSIVMSNRDIFTPVFTDWSVNFAPMTNWNLSKDTYSTVATINYCVIHEPPKKE